MKNDRITYMKRIFELLGSKLNETDLKWHIDQIIRLETDLLDISIGISQVKTQTTATSCYPLHIFKVSCGIFSILLPVFIPEIYNFLDFFL